VWHSGYGVSLGKILAIGMAAIHLRRTIKCQEPRAQRVTPNVLISADNRLDTAESSLYTVSRTTAVEKSFSAHGVFGDA
jgi:hypothetical protein